MSNETKLEELKAIILSKDMQALLAHNPAPAHLLERFSSALVDGAIQYLSQRMTLEELESLPGDQQRAVMLRACDATIDRFISRIMAKYPGQTPEEIAFGVVALGRAATKGKV